MSRAVVVRGLQRGFTLIEMLVVIGIIIGLAAIIFPVGSNLVGRANSARTISNLQQISVGMLQYVQDNNNNYPQPYPYGNVSVGWLFSLAENGYMNDGITQVSVAQLKKLYNPTARKKFPNGYNSGGYAMAAYMGIFAPASRNAVTKLSRTVILADGMQGPDNCQQILWDYPGVVYPPSTTSGGFAHYAFCDGHVERIASEDPKALNSLPVGYNKEVFFSPWQYPND